VTNDGTIDLGDPVNLLNHLFQGGPAPVDPGGPSEPRGEDPDPLGTPGHLGCVSYVGC